MIDKYIVDYKDYPMKEIMNNKNMLEESTIYQYVANSFLDGLINYVEIINIFLINESFDKITKTFNSNKTININTLKDLIKEFENGNIIYHTPLNIFQSDVVILGKTENYYYHFYYNQDVSDCDILRFQTDDTEEEIIKNIELTFKDKNIIKINPTWLEGWISWSSK